MLYAIETEEITKRFDDIVAVNKVSISVKPGELFGLLGPNGAGKTTLISMLSTIAEPTSGKAKVWGFDVEKESSKVRENIGMVFQDTTLDDRLTGKENLDLHGRLYGLDGKTRKKRIEEVLALVELTERADSIVRTFSGGMMRRLEIARDLVTDPLFILLDEPFSGIDPIAVAECQEIICSLKDKGLGILLTDHNVRETLSITDRSYIMADGKVLI